MKSKLVLGVLAAAVLLVAPSAQADDLASKLVGTYSSKETNFITVKRLSFSKEKDGSLKVHGTLVGFPDEVSIGDATVEAYADRNNKPNPDVVVASFSAERYKPLMVISAMGPLDGGHLRFVNFTCYLRDADGTKVHVSGQLVREN